MSKKVYFASDFHLGVPTPESSRSREQRIVNWLSRIQHDATDIYLVGDLFDFWFEYKYVVPKGFVRLQGKLAELVDAGINVHLFHGNHDLWQFGYFEQEIGCKVHAHPIIVNHFGKQFYIAHGDGLGPGQKRFKLILSIYRNRFFQRLFASFHPSIGMSIANWFSHQSKLQTFDANNTYKGDEKEHLILHAKSILHQQVIDYFIFGHRHLAFDKTIQSARVINLGDWFSTDTYAVFDGIDVKLISNIVK